MALTEFENVPEDCLRNWIFAVIILINTIGPKIAITDLNNIESSPINGIINEFNCRGTQSFFQSFSK